MWRFNNVNQAELYDMDTPPVALLMTRVHPVHSLTHETPFFDRTYDFLVFHLQRIIQVDYMNSCSREISLAQGWAIIISTYWIITRQLFFI